MHAQFPNLTVIEHLLVRHRLTFLSLKKPQRRDFTAW